MCSQSTRLGFLSCSSHFNIQWYLQSTNFYLTVSQWHHSRGATKDYSHDWLNFQLFSNGQKMAKAMSPNCLFCPTNSLKPRWQNSHAYSHRQSNSFDRLIVAALHHSTDFNNIKSPSCTHYLGWIAWDLTSIQDLRQPDRRTDRQSLALPTVYSPES